MVDLKNIKVMTIGQISEEDWNIHRALNELNIPNLHVDIITKELGYFIKIPYFEPYIYSEFGNNIIDYADQYKPDCIIVRVGWSFKEENIKNLISYCEKENIPIVCWCQEQGVNFKFQLSVAKHFKHIFSSNLGDINTYKEEGIEKVDYAPFGCVPSFHKESEKYSLSKCDITAFGRMQASNEKLESARFLLKNIVNLNKYIIKLWGEGWEEFKDYFMGKFTYYALPEVVTNSKIVLGAHANTNFSLCYGSRLARVLGCKGFLLWDYTKDMEQEFTNKEGLVWVKRDENPGELIEYYLDNEDERNKIAKKGQEIAYEKYNYLKILPKMIEKIIEGGD